MEDVKLEEAVLDGATEIVEKIVDEETSELEEETSELVEETVELVEEA